MNLLHICGERFEGNVYQHEGKFIFDPVECPSCGQELTDAETQPDRKTDNTIMTRQQAQNTVQRYCCSNCWGHVIIYPIVFSDLVRVICPRCGEETKGFVSQQYAERRRLESFADRAQAGVVLRNVIKTSASDKSEDQLLHELGF
jgi:hypothetical protein